MTTRGVTIVWLPTCTVASTRVKVTRGLAVTLAAEGLGKYFADDANTVEAARRRLGLPELA